MQKLETIASIRDEELDAGSDIIESDVEITGGNLLRIGISLSAAHVFQITLNGSDYLDVNDGTALKANALYVFELMVHNNDIINFKIGDNVAVTVNAFDCELYKDG